MNKLPSVGAIVGTVAMRETRVHRRGVPRDATGGDASQELGAPAPTGWPRKVTPPSNCGNRGCPCTGTRTAVGWQRCASVSGTALPAAWLQDRWSAIPTWRGGQLCKMIAKFIINNQYKSLLLVWGLWDWLWTMITSYGDSSRHSRSGTTMDDWDCQGARRLT